MAEPAAARSGSAPSGAVYDLSEYRLLRVWAEMFADAQLSRMRVEARVASAPVLPEVFAAELVEARAAEARIGLGLRRQYRRTAPPGVLLWQRATPGMGEHLVARLVGRLGHPRIATPAHWEGCGARRRLVADEPYERTVGELRQYCGHGRPGRPRRGMEVDELVALGVPELKRLVFLLSEAAIKEPGRRIGEVLDLASLDHGLSARPISVSVPNQQAAGRQSGAATATPTTGWGRASWRYRALYEQRRLATVGRAHLEACVRCGPAGRPAGAGTLWAAAHSHADALRVVGKAILLDLWLAAADDGLDDDDGAADDVIADRADGETAVAGELVGMSS